MSTPPPAPLPGTPRIAIIGGGISGLAAAHRLTELLPNASLTLFESSDRLGGILETVHRNGFLIERSADNFLTKPLAAAELCRQLGMAADLLPTDDQRRRAFVVCDGRLVPIPDGFYLMSPRKLWPLLTSPLLSWPAKVRLLAEPFVPSRKPSPSGRGQGEGPLTADESVASFARRRLGRETFEKIVQPLVAGIYTADPEQLSMAATMPQFLEMEHYHGSLLRATLFRRRPDHVTPFRRRTGHFSDQSNQPPSPPDADQASGARYGLFTAPKAGMTSLVTALAASQRLAGAVHLNTRVKSILQASNQWQLYLPLPLGEGHGEGLTFDALVLAVPAHAAARLLETVAADLAAELDAIPYASCAVISLGFARRQIGHALDGFGFVVPSRERRPIIAASFASLKYPGRAPTDCVLIRTFIGGALRPELLGKPDAELIRIALDELSDLLAVTGEPLVTDVARWPDSMPQYLVGHLQRVARIEQLAARWPSLALAGNAYRGVGIPQCIASGQAAAERLAATLDR